MFDIQIILVYVVNDATSNVRGGYRPREVDNGYYPPQIDRHDWSDSFVYVTKCLSDYKLFIFF